MALESEEKNVNKNIKVQRRKLDPNVSKEVLQKALTGALDKVILSKDS